MGDNRVPWGCSVQGDAGWSSPCREGFAGGTPGAPGTALINQQASELQCMPVTISLTEIPELFAARRDASAARTAKRAARRAAALLPYGFLCANPCSATIPIVSCPLCSHPCAGAAQDYLGAGLLCLPALSLRTAFPTTAPSFTLSHLQTTKPKPASRWRERTSSSFNYREALSHRGEEKHGALQLLTRIHQPHKKSFQLLFAEALKSLGRGQKCGVIHNAGNAQPGPRAARTQITTWLWGCQHVWQRDLADPQHETQRAVAQAQPTPLPKPSLPQHGAAAPLGRDVARPVHQCWHPVPSFPGGLLGRAASCKREQNAQHHLHGSCEAVGTL